VRQAARAALRQTGGEVALAALRQALTDDVPHVRAAACQL